MLLAPALGQPWSSNNPSSQVWWSFLDACSEMLAEVRAGVNCCPSDVGHSLRGQRPLSVVSSCSLGPRTPRLSLGEDDSDIRGCKDRQ